MSAGGTMPGLSAQALQNLKLVWDGFKLNFNSLQLSSINVPQASVPALGGSAGMDYLASRFRAMIEAPVSIIKETQPARIVIKPQNDMFGHTEIVPKVSSSKHRAAGKAKVARPPNAFILYRQQHHPLLKSMYPDLHNNQISIILGTQWKNESSENKSRYINLARRLKVKHLEQHPGYHYQPRKSSEKKRRLSRRKTLKPTTATSTVLEADSTSAAVAATSDNTAPTNADHGTDNVLELPRTAEGNIVIELGESSIGDDDLRRLLEQHNSQVAISNAQAVANAQATAANQPAANPQHPFAVHPAANNHPIALAAANPAPALYQEPTEEGQDDDNFFNAFVDYEAYLKGMDGAKEIAHELSFPLDYDTPEALAAYDAANAKVANAEMFRQARLVKDSTNKKLANLEFKIKLGLKVDVDINQVRADAKAASENLEWLEANEEALYADTLAILSSENMEFENGQDEQDEQNEM